jgi:hypothetical protein
VDHEIGLGLFVFGTEDPYILSSLHPVGLVFNCLYQGAISHVQGLGTGY